jgi:hypothetical protein
LPGVRGSAQVTEEKVKAIAITIVPVVVIGLRIAPRILLFFRDKFAWQRCQKQGKNMTFCHLAKG